MNNYRGGEKKKKLKSMVLSDGWKEQVCHWLSFLFVVLYYFTCIPFLDHNRSIHIAIRWS